MDPVTIGLTAAGSAGIIAFFLWLCKNHPREKAVPKHLRPVVQKSGKNVYIDTNLGSYATEWFSGNWYDLGNGTKIEHVTPLLNIYGKWKEEQATKEAVRILRADKPIQQLFSRNVTTRDGKYITIGSIEMYQRSFIGLSHTISAAYHARVDFEHYITDDIDIFYDASNEILWIANDSYPIRDALSELGTICEGLPNV